jgi:ferredoxin-NADP reductase
MDASHRGGDPGFVTVVDDGRLAIPDYPGNNHYNTIGNLELDPRAGLLFVSFATGSLLQLTGRVTVDWHPDAATHAERVLHFDVDEVVEQPSVLPLRWETDAGDLRELRVAEKIRESDDVASFVLVASDGRPLSPFEAGQYLPIALDVPGGGEPLRRTYSLSGAPSTERYRITVKREPHGTASRFLHDAMDVGVTLRAGAPTGDFVIGCRSCPVVLVSAGIGLTPFVSMLHAILAEGSARPVWFVHGARDGRHRPLAAELRALAARRSGIAVHVAYSRPRAEDSGYDSVGRVDGALLERLVSAPDAHYFLCGPIGFMAAVQADLERRGVGAERIHSESFGPRHAAT